MALTSGDYTSDIRKLSEKFYHDYPASTFPEIERKRNRGYELLLIDTHGDYFICVPFRSHIKHGNAYLFNHSVRSQTMRSGLDYSKICIVRNPDYIDDGPAVIDQDEYNEMRDCLDNIVNAVCRYVEDYIAYEKGNVVMSKTQYKKRYRYSTLPYFHPELGL